MQKITLVGFIKKYFFSHMPQIISGMFFLIAAKVASTIEPIYIKKIIDGFTQEKSINFLLSLLAIYFGIKIIEIISQFLRDWIIAPVIMGISQSFETATFKHLLSLPMNYHADTKTGSSARAVTRGSQSIGFILDFSISEFLPPFFEMLFVTIFLLKFYSWEYGVVTLLTIVIYAFFTIWGTEKRIKYRYKANENDDQASGILVDSVTNIDTVKYFHNEGNILNKFSIYKYKWYLNSIKDNRVFAAVYAGQAIILLLGLGIILFKAVNQAYANIISIGDIVLVSTYVVRLTIPLTTLGFIYGRFKNSFADISAMEEIFNEKIEIKEPSRPIKIKSLKGEVKFNNVKFGYNSKRKIFDGLSFHIKKGEKIAFVGPSGAGKSTLAKLLFRIYDVTGGEIFIDNVNLTRISNKDRKKLLAIVPQEPLLFNDTLKENILFGDQEANMDQIIEASKTAQIFDFINSLPKKFETRVGERGIKISGGERQRIAIARAVLANPKILVFDEATSSLDSNNEKKVLETIQNVAKNRTSISIAHRLSTIVDSDKIYVLKKGRVVEVGTHQELLEKNGEYATLWKLQTRHKKIEVSSTMRQKIL